MKKAGLLSVLAAASILLTAACSTKEQADTGTAGPALSETAEQEITETAASETAAAEQEEEAMTELCLSINDKEIPVIWEDNESVRALRELAAQQPLTIAMSMYGGFEQVGPIGTSLPRNDRQTVTEAGDIVLYSGNQIVMFYGSNSWAYTRLGKADQSASQMKELLGNGDVTVTITCR